MERQHLVGKVCFQLETSTRAGAESLFDRSSSLTQVQLPQVLEDLFEELAFPPTHYLKIDRLVLDLGKLSMHNFEAELLQKLQKALRQVLQKHLPLPLPGNSISSKAERNLQLLHYFLLRGNFPWWISSSELESIDLDLIWADLLAQQPEKALALLQEIILQKGPRSRFFQQFSETSQQLVDQLLAESPGLLVFWQESRQDLAHNIPLISTKSSYAQYPEQNENSISPPEENIQAQAENLLLAAFTSSQTQDEKENIAVNLADSKSESFSGQMPEHQLNSPEQNVLYFLEWSRMPHESILRIAQVEAALIHYLQNQPGAARENLRRLARRVNLALRLLQFSTTTHQAVLQVIFIDQWTALKALLNDLEKFPTLLGFKPLDAQFLWKNALQKLLSPAVPAIDFVGLLAHLFEQIIAQQRDDRLLDPSAVFAELTPDLRAKFQPITQKALLLLNGNLNESEQTQLQETFQSWTDTSQPGEVQSAAILLDQLRFRLRYGHTPWWDIQAKSLADLWAELGELPPSELSFVLSHLMEERLFAALDLTPQTYLQYFSVFWGAYANWLEWFLFLWEKVAARWGLNSLFPFLNQALLWRALHSNVINSTVLLEWILQELVKISPYTRTQWLSALLAESQTSAYAADYRYQGLREVLVEMKDPQQEGETLDELPPMPPSRGVLSVFYPQSILPLPLQAEVLTEDPMPTHPTSEPPLQVGVLVEGVPLVHPAAEPLLQAEVPAKDSLLEYPVTEPPSQADASIKDSTLAHPATELFLQKETPTEDTALMYPVIEPPMQADASVKDSTLAHPATEPFSQKETPTEDTLLAHPSVEPPMQADASAKDSVLLYPELIRSDIEALLRFLHQGTLAPEHPIPHPSVLEDILLRLMSKHGEVLRPALLSVLVQKASIDRILHFFSRPAWVALGRFLWPKEYEQIQTLWLDILMRFGKSDQLTLHRHFFSFLFQQSASREPQVFNALDFVSNLLQHLAKQEGIPLANILQIIQTVPPNPQQGASSKDLSQEPTSAPRSSPLDPLLPGLTQRIKQLDAASRQGTPSSAPNTPVPIEEAILVHNAGLVLLALYLPRYFRTLGLVEDQAFVDEAAAARGVHLIQYLATRQSVAPEQWLVLNKILCGLPLYTPLEPGIVLSEAEADLSESLLQGVLANWSSMRQSSVHNLQAAFLLRNGVLREDLEKWHLQVESKTYDVLLMDLPWTISIIKLPWMEKRIEVTWKYPH